MERVISRRVSAELDGVNVLTVLKKELGMSTSLIKELKKSVDGLLLNGVRTRTVDAVKEGDVVSVTLRDEKGAAIPPADIRFGVAYEDEDIMVVVKPAGIPTHPVPGNYENTLANGVIRYYLNKGEERVFRAVNRLDKDTSGLMVTTKNAYAQARLCAMLHTNDFVRKYRCIVCGDVERGGTVDAPIAVRDGALKRVISEEGKRAVTHYKTLERLNGYTLLEVALETGRTHQIRAHMAHIGHPIAGDWLYGTEDKENIPRQMLHSSYLSFVHPVSGEKLVIESDIPQDMQDFIEKTFLKLLK